LFVFFSITGDTTKKNILKNMMMPSEKKSEYLVLTSYAVAVTALQPRRMPKETDLNVNIIAGIQKKVQQSTMFL